MTVTAPFTAAGSTITLDDIAGTCRRGRDAPNRFRFLLLTGLLYCRTNLRRRWAKEVGLPDGIRFDVGWILYCLTASQQTVYH